MWALVAVASGFLAPLQPVAPFVSAPAAPAGPFRPAALDGRVNAAHSQVSRTELAFATARLPRSVDNVRGYGSVNVKSDEICM